MPSLNLAATSELSSSDSAADGSTQVWPELSTDPPTKVLADSHGWGYEALSHVSSAEERSRPRL